MYVYLESKTQEFKISIVFAEITHSTRVPPHLFRDVRIHCIGSLWFLDQLRIKRLLASSCLSVRPPA
jgi:hypothetical protein